MYHFLGRPKQQGVGQVQAFTSLYCENLKRTCVVQTVKDEAVAKCQAGKNWSINKDCAVAPGATEITDADKGHFTPCQVANMPVCGGDGDPDDGEDFLDQNTTYIVGGILGLLVVGGVAYAVMKKKKKGKR